jgi:hypothetical protein
MGDREVKSVKGTSYTTAKLAQFIARQMTFILKEKGKGLMDL